MRLLVVGDGSLAVRCAEIALGLGHQLAGIMTSRERVRQAAERAGLPCRQSERLSAEQVIDCAAGGFDVLLSIFNLRLLPPAVLELPALLAVNYHDALLPRHAGLHATSWALALGERMHGVTWHRMVEKLDAGAILVQRAFPILDDDTAYSLNSRCYQAGLDSFGELLDLLAAGRTAGRPQDVAARTFHAGRDKPTAGCFVPFERSAEEIIRFARALDLGPHERPIGDARLWIGGRPVAVRRPAASPRTPGLEPGQVSAALAQGIVVTTPTLDVRFDECLDENGEPISLAGLGVGDDVRLPAGLAGPIAETEAAVWRHERAWVQRLRDARPLDLARAGFAGGEAAGTSTVDVTGVELRVAAEWADLQLACLAMLFARRLRGGFDLGVAAGGSAGVASELSRLFATVVPLRIDLGAGGGLTEALEALARDRQVLLGLRTHARDLRARYPELRERPPWVHDVVVGVEGEAAAATLDRGRRVTIWIRGATRQLRFETSETGLAAELASAWSQLAGELAGARAAPVRPAASLAEPVHRRFEAWAARTPLAPALAGPGLLMTYNELDARADRLAGALAARGAGPEDVVGLLVTPGVDTVVSVLAVLKAGAAFVVFDPVLPDPRIATMAEVARPMAIVASSALESRARPLGAPVVAVDPGSSAPPPPRDPPGGADRLAYLVFTSGSSGAPRAVAVEHGALANCIGAVGAIFDLDPRDRILAIGSAGFDLAYEQIFGALCHGAALVVCDHAIGAGTRAFLDLCGELGITVLDLPTAYFAALAADLLRGRYPVPVAVRLVVIGGERAPAELCRCFVRRFGGRPRLINSYGPTEATITATWCDIEDRAGEVPIGRAIAGATVHVLDEDRRSATSGELYLGGLGLARGYLGAPAETRERFVFHPEHGRLYRTGDRVQLGPDGALEYLGRVDRQLKVRGFRVEPEEVERALLRQPGITAAVVDVIDGTLTAWLMASGTPPAVVELSSALSASLPPYLVPRGFHFVAALPLTVNGKVDAKALRGAPRPVATAAPPAHGTATEQTLTAVFESALGRSPIGPRDDFFALGGDSLTAVRMLDEVERRLGARLPLDVLLGAPTVEKLAALLAGRSPMVARCIEVLQPEGAMPPLFLVHGVGGHLLRARRMVAMLGTERAVFGIRSPALDATWRIPERIEGIAEAYVSELRRARPREPRLLVGFSMGGLIALEMARQLARTGEPPALLALLDSALPLTRTERLLWDARTPTIFVRNRIEALAVRWRRRSGRPVVSAGPLHQVDAVLQAHRRAFAVYQPERYRGHALFIRSQSEISVRQRRRWGRLVQNLDVVDIPGDHPAVALSEAVAETIAGRARAALRVSRDGR